MISKFITKWMKYKRKPLRSIPSQRKGVFSDEKLFSFWERKKKLDRTTNIEQTDVINMYLYGISAETTEFDAMMSSEKAMYFMSSAAEKKNIFKSKRDKLEYWVMCDTMNADWAQRKLKSKIEKLNQENGLSLSLKYNTLRYIKSIRFSVVRWDQFVLAIWYA